MGADAAGADVRAHDRVLLAAPMKTWRCDSVPVVDQPPIDRLRQFPREPDLLIYGLRSLCALVAGRDLTVVPCFIDGSFQAWPEGKRFPRPDLGPATAKGLERHDMADA